MFSAPEMGKTVFGFLRVILRAEPRLKYNHRHSVLSPFTFLLAATIE